MLPSGRIGAIILGQSIMDLNIMTSNNKVTTKPRKRAPRNYLNNNSLLQEVIKSKEQGEMTDELVKMLMLLIDRIGSKGNYSGYSFLDDMKGNAALTLVRVWMKFNPERSSNPFAYYTQVIENAFKQDLTSERNQRNIRDALLMDHDKNPSHTYAEAYQQRIRAEIDEAKAAEEELYDVE